MQHPDAELLAAVTLGEEVDAAVSTHLAQCAACRGEVDELVRVVGSVRADATLVAPPPAVWDAVSARIASATGTTSEAPRPRGVPRRRVIGWLAAAAGAAVGASATWLLSRPDPTPPPLASVDLTTLDTREVLGEAKVRDSAQGVTLAVRTQPLDPGDGYLEVWLINRDLVRMVSVGVLPPGPLQQDFPIALRLLEEGYVVVDISRESFDDRPGHSGDSLMRGELPI